MLRGPASQLPTSLSQRTNSSERSVQVVEGGGSFEACAGGSSSSSLFTLFMLLTLPVPLRCEDRSGLLPPGLRASGSARRPPASSSRLLFWNGSIKTSPSLFTPEWVSRGVVLGPLIRSASEVGCIWGSVGPSCGGTLDLDLASVRRLLNELFRRRP